MKSVTYTEMTYSEVEDLAKKHFGINYEFLADEECINDSNKTYLVEESKPCDKWDADNWKEWAEFLEGKGNKRMWRAHMFMERLVHLGHVPPGNILVEVSW